MDKDKKYEVEIFLPRENIRYTTAVFEGKEDVEALEQVLSNISDLKHVFFKKPCGAKLILTSSMINQCIFHLREVS